MLTFKGLGATEIGVGTRDAGVPLPILAPVFMTSYLSSAVGSSPCLQSILRYRSTLRYCNSLHPEGSLTTLHCTLMIRFLHMLQVTTLSCYLTSLGSIRVRDIPDTAKAVVGAAPH